MASNFDDLAAIIGPVLTSRIMVELGGQIIKIRKRMISAQEQYRNDEIFYSEGCTVKDGARRLGCTEHNLRALRRKTRERKGNG